MPPTSFIKTGHFQSLTLDSSAQSITITDTLYGTHRITEPVLLALLRSPILLRLTKVHQHGITGLLGLTPPVTRYEHSVGAFLLVKHVGGSLHEQIAALLHDVSHSALSHVLDFAGLQPPPPPPPASASSSSLPSLPSLPHDPGSSFHESHKPLFLSLFPQLPALLTSHGIPLSVLDESLYPLVETPSPQLCADRLDYGLRDCVGFGKLDPETAGEIFGQALRAFPDAESSRRVLVLREKDGGLGLRLARAYREVDREVWSDAKHAEMGRRVGRLIGEMVRGGKMEIEELWELEDGEVWERMKGEYEGREEGEMLKGLEREGLKGLEGQGKGQGKGVKIRTLDPDVWIEGTQEPVSLSVARPEWGREREAYILGRDRERVE